VPISYVSGLQASLDTLQPKIGTGTLSIANTSGLHSALDAKASQSQVNTLTTDVLNKQPLDSTNTLVSLPKNLSTTTTYLSGFPNDQLSWSTLGSATFTNSTGMQYLKFPIIDSEMNVSISSSISASTVCTVSVAVKLDTAYSFTMMITKSTTLLASQNFSPANCNINNSSFTSCSMTFTVPSSGNLKLSVGPSLGIGNTIGSVYTADGLYSLEVQG
jgi:hypothetical protein